MTYKDYIKLYKKNEHPASTIFHKYVSKNLAKFIVFVSLKFGVSPNSLSLFSTLCLALAGYFLVSMNSFWLFILLTQISYGLVCSDGVVARITNQKSIFGKFLDIALDRINMLIFYGSIILYYWETNYYHSNDLAFYRRKYKLGNIGFLKLISIFRFKKFSSFLKKFEGSAFRKLNREVGLPCICLQNYFK